MMNDTILKERLRRLIRRQLWFSLGWKLALCWTAAAAAGAAMIWLQRETGWASSLTLPLLAGLATMAATAVAIHHHESAPDFRAMAQRIENAHPELKGLLLTAVQQELAPGAAPNFLQHRVLEEATRRCIEDDWTDVVPRARVLAAHGAQVAALGVLVLALAGVRTAEVKSGAAWPGAEGVAVTPGDTNLERGESLVVLARFGRSLPPSVNLVVRESGAPVRTIPLVKALADPVFGGSVPEVAHDLTYHLEYRGERTREFKVAVFEHPRLVRADADLAFPAYTRLPPKHIEDTRRLSAVEGTKLDLTLNLNKPVASAKLVARDPAKTALALQLEPGRPVARLPAFRLAASGVYDLQLVDAEGRANKVASPFFIEVQPNRPPELRLTSPRGDVRPSALEEIAFDGTVFDDFGSPAYGLTYAIAGGETRSLELGRDTAAKEKRAFSYTLRLEDLGARPDDLVSWFVWADDIGPDGKVRRTNGDMFFGEVRPFDEIFRESQQQQSPDQAQQGGQGNQARRLTDLQKQIINATWNLQRAGQTPKYADDEKVVRESQSQALAQAEEGLGSARSPRAQGMWQAVAQEMVQALDELKNAAQTPAPLPAALKAEQAALSALLKLQAREMQVARGRNQRGGANGGAMNQRQIDELDLQQADNRYETQRQAQAPQTRQRQEQLQVMNRLQELASRQQDLNDRLKELQTALQEARTDAEREEVRRRLKRLEEEQRQMLADMDELRQRMDRPENQSGMAQQRQQLDQTRDDAQRAADAAAQGSVPQALAAGTRAQRSLQQMRDELRKESSSQFADDMRDMRAEARELSRQQEQVNRQLDQLGASQRKTLGDSGERQQLLDQLAQQRDRQNKLVERAEQVSQQAENSEPLLSRQLEDSVKKLSQDDLGTVKSTKEQLLREGLLTRDLYQRLQEVQERDAGGKTLDLTRELLADDNVAQARDAGQRARAGIDELRRGVERAAESVLGDDTEQLKLVQSELDQLTQQLQREMEQAQGGARDGRNQNQNRDANQRVADAGSQNRNGGGQRDANPPDNSTQPGAVANQNQDQASQPAENNQPGQNAPSGQRGGARSGQVARDGQRDGSLPRDGPGGRGGIDLSTAFDGGSTGDAGGVSAWRWRDGDYVGGPLTGANFGPWTERLRDVQTLLDSPDQRNAVATALERARLLRRDFTVDRKKPDWAVVQLQIVKPLVEVRARVAEELARHDAKDSLAPIDRDPVPNRFAESVRRYYEELGKDKPDSK